MCKAVGVDSHTLSMVLGVWLHTLQIADNQIITANDKEDLTVYENLKTQEEYKKWELVINTQKTRYLLLGADLSNEIRY